MSDYLSPKELAEHWKIPLQELYPLIASGIVPALKIDNQWYISATILDKVKSLG